MGIMDFLHQLEEPDVLVEAHINDVFDFLAVGGGKDKIITSKNTYEGILTTGISFGSTAPPRIDLADKSLRKIVISQGIKDSFIFYRAIELDLLKTGGSTLVRFKALKGSIQDKGTGQIIGKVRWALMQKFKTRIATKEERLAAEKLMSVPAPPIKYPQHIELSDILALRSSYALILANLIPLFGVLFFGWSVALIVVVYWTENISIGFFNILKMLIIGLKKKRLLVALFLAAFFAFHYGIFTLAQGFAVFFLFAIQKTALAGGTSTGPIVIPIGPILIPAFLLFMSHGFSFLDNFVLKKAYEKSNLMDQMLIPYKRVLVMQLTAVIGIFAVSYFNAPIVALMVMILIKIYLDLRAHSREHTEMGPQDD